MTTQRQQVIAKILVSAAIAVGSCIGVAAPASADQYPNGTDPNPFGALDCGCRGTAPLGGSAEEIERGLRTGLAARLPRTSTTE
jgi:hypothetical protein